MREAISRVATKSQLHKVQIETLLKQKEFSSNVFLLFDESCQGFLIQDNWVSMLKASTSTFSDDESGRVHSQELLDLVELLEAVTYLVCQDNHVVPDTFFKIWTSRGVATKLMRVIDTDADDVITVEDFMVFVIRITNPRKRTVLTEENINWLEQVFKSNVGKGKDEFTISEFKKIVPSKNEFFVERAFRIFDKDGSGTVSLPEFIETMHQFSGQGDDEKISFLFKVYDLNDDGMIDESDLREVMKACMVENGMDFDDKDIRDLANALFDDAVREGQDAINVDDLKAQLQRHEGLLENMTISIGKWLVPPKPVKPKPFPTRMMEKLPQSLTPSYWRNNKPFFFLLSLIIGVNIILFVHRTHYFRHFSNLDGSSPNPFYLLSRGCGRVILFNSVLVLFLVLRYTMTIMRSLGLGAILPIDHNIYFHKIVGWIIFAQAWIHTIMHLFNFGINVQPNPVRFVQLTASYWRDHVGDWSPFGFIFKLGYKVPPLCSLVDTGLAFKEFNITLIPNTSHLMKYCLPEDIANPLYLCQECSSKEGAAPWSYIDWIFTMQPGMFGMPGGIANISGVALILILVIITVCSLPFVRRSGYFQVFYVTHMLYFFYWGFLVIHAPEFWKWFIGPAVLFVFELVFRILSSFLGKGKTLVSAGILLPSRVTHVIIKRPPGFNFSPGDWVFVKIPSVARFEWHPFTISSAPEVHDTFTIHIRGVGEWTNRIYQHFEEEYARQQDGSDVFNYGRIGKFTGTVRQKYDNARVMMSKSMKVKPTDDPIDFVKLADKYNVDKERQEQRMKARESKLRQLSNTLSEDSETDKTPTNNNNEKTDDEEEEQSHNHEGEERKETHHVSFLPEKTVANPKHKKFLKSLRYIRQQPALVKYDTGSNTEIQLPEGLVYDNGTERFDIEVGDGAKRSRKESRYDGPGRRTRLNKPLEIYIDGPFGSPSSNIYRAEHAVLVATGIGVTPYASILQSIMHRYWQVKKTCPKCEYQWSDDLASMFNLRKVDFYWINRDQKHFEWFVKLLSQLEIEQAEQGGAMGRFLDMHMYITSALQRTDMKAVGLQLALDLLHEKDKRDLVTGLKSRTQAGRPNWNKVFSQIREQNKGKVTIFFCGNPSLGKVLKTKCNEFGFQYKKETF